MGWFQCIFSYFQVNGIGLHARLWVLAMSQFVATPFAVLVLYVEVCLVLVQIFKFPFQQYDSYVNKWIPKCEFFAAPIRHGCLDRILLMRRDLVRHFVHRDCWNRLPWNTLNHDSIVYILYEQYWRKFSDSCHNSEETIRWRLQNGSLYILAWIYRNLKRIILLCIIANDE